MVVASLSRPGGNVAGQTFSVEGMYVKAFELLHEAVPSATRITAFSDPYLPSSPLHALVEGTARARGVTLSRVEVGGAPDLDLAFEAALRDRAQALYLYPLRVLPPEIERIVAFATRHRLPVIGVAHVAYSFTGNGILFYLGSEVEEEDRRLASYIDRILKGAKPGDLPVEQPTKFEFIVNAKAADAIGLAVPTSLLLRADKVVR
jgi:putative ABC transport system substrate-binding protein